MTETLDLTPGQAGKRLEELGFSSGTWGDLIRRRKEGYIYSHEVRALATIALGTKMRDFVAVYNEMRAQEGESAIVGEKLRQFVEKRLPIARMLRR
jgi:hypothetical protein